MLTAFAFKISKYPDARARIFAGSCWNAASTKHGSGIAGHITQRCARMKQPIWTSDPKITLFRDGGPR